MNYPCIVLHRRSTNVVIRSPMSVFSPYQDWLLTIICKMIEYNTISHTGITESTMTLQRTWLIGMKMSFTKKPKKPTARNPTAVKRATLMNSFLSGFWHRFTSLQWTKYGKDRWERAQEGGREPFRRLCMLPLRTILKQSVISNHPWRTWRCSWQTRSETHLLRPLWSTYNVFLSKLRISITNIQLFKQYYVNIRGYYYSQGTALGEVFIQSRVTIAHSLGNIKLIRLCDERRA